MDFRIPVCLDTFFNDERSYCYIFLNNSYEYVSDLENHLSKMFSISENFCLMTDMYYLPSSESIKILRPDDIITVRISNFAKPSDNNCQVNITNKADIDAIKGIDEPADRCDRSLKKKKKKKSKRSTADDDDVTADVSFNIKIEEEIDGLARDANEERSTPKAAEKDSTMESLSYDCQSKSDTTNRPSDMSVTAKYQSGEETNNNSDHEEMPLDMDGLENMIIKRIEELKKSSLVSGDKLKQINETSSGRIIKRKRIRKRKKGNNIIQNIVPDVKSAMPNNSLLLMQGSKISNHIRFDDSEKTVVQNGLGNRAIEKPRIVHAIETLASSNLISEKFKISENNMQNHCSETAKPDAITNGDNKVENSLLLKDVVPNLCKYQLIDSQPLQGVILFKILTMAENYIPKVSEYILGRIVESHGDANILKLNIIDGHKECQKPSGKFDLEDKTGIMAGDIEIEWSQVCEARLIYS